MHFTYRVWEYISPIHTVQFERDLRVIHDCDVIIRNSIVNRGFKPHLKFLANRVSASIIFEHLGCARRIFRTYKQKTATEMTGA